MESIKEMLDRLTDMKITDPQVLLKLYNMYRYRIFSEDENVVFDDEPEPVEYHDESKTIPLKFNEDGFGVDE